MRLVLALAATLLAAGCVQPVGPAGTSPDDPDRRSSLLTFSAPLELTADGHGYEPSIEIDAYGTLYVTAHKGSLTNEGTRLASWLWFSRDEGATWKEMPSPLQQHDKLFAFEGDLALDAKGRLYFVDSYFLDSTLSRWTTGPDGPSWESTRPVQGTTALDDRPWLAAHGDGILYALGNNNGRAPIPAPNTLLEGERANIWLYRSTDGGDTWTPGHGFPGAVWCTMDASRADDQTLYVGCEQGDHAVVHRSADRGETWTTAEVGTYRNGPGALYPATALDQAGHAYHAWIDGFPGSGAPGRILVARTLDGETWDPYDITPLNGTFGMLWATGGAPGTLALTFYATEDVQPNDDTEWRVHLLLGTGLDGAEPRWEHAVVDPEPALIGPFPPIDFFQNAIGPDGAVHIAYQREPAGQLVGGMNGDVYYVRQTGGGNVRLAAEP